MLEALFSPEVMGLLLPAIPRLLTAFAEWAAVVCVVLLTQRRFSWFKTVLILGLALLIQITLRCTSEDYHNRGVFAFYMVLNVGFMLLCLKLLTKETLCNLLFAWLMAFLLAEFTASVTWQICAGFAVEPTLLSRTTALCCTLSLLAISAVFVLFIRFFETSISIQEWTYTIIAIGIALLVFVASNVNVFREALWRDTDSSDMREMIGWIRTMADLCGLVLLWLLLRASREHRLRQEMENMDRLMDSQYQQYLAFRDSNEYIRRQSHDLKHQIAALRENTSAEEKETYLSEMEQVIRQYQAQCDTGNRVLDTILTQKILLCNQHGIALSYNASAKSLEQIDVQDICNLFGNLLDNAMEAVRDLPESDRLIQLDVYTRNQFLMIQAENRCPDPPEIRDGLPVTTKKDKHSHGIGTRSIRHTVEKYGGTGSGALSDAMAKVDLLTGLTDAGLKLNTEISDFYTAYCAERPALGYGEHFWTLPEPTADSYSQDLINNAKSFSDTAMIVISRIGGEFADLPTDMAVTRQEGSLDHYEDNTDAYQDFPDGQHYLSLSKTEQDMVDLVCANFNNVILVYNSANTLELGFVDNYEQIKSVIWCPGPGQTGFEALGEIVTGAVNPSGKATDTFVYDLKKAPWFNNFGTFTYTNADEFSYENTGTFTYGTTTPHFVNYVDGIYVGYKFYETAAKEGVIDYDQYVQYPFGHGLSYTTFEQKMGDIQTAADGTITFDVTVTNTGAVAGKDVVQVYFDPPYTNGGIEKASANLVTFAKTSELAPGASETLTLTFNRDDMASFDAYGKGSYVLEAGDYTISINADSHTVLDSKVYTVGSEIVYGEGNARTGDLQAATVAFDFAEGDAQFLSRANSFGNLVAVTAAPTDFTMSDAIKATFYNTYNWNPEDFNDPNDVMPKTGANNGIKLQELRGLSFDDPKWDDLLDELTIHDMDYLIALGGYGTMAINHIGKSATNDNDGPANITNNFTGGASIGFPSEVIIASTFNQELVERFGESIGEMADELDVSGWYAPGMDSHRSAFDGRNFEYYSEDGVLAGKIGAAAVRGAQSKGLFAYMKHFVLNDQQAAQAEMLCTWVSEQALREIFLKPFEICVKEAGCSGVMAAWNYIGNQWCGASNALMNTVLRDEWGFQGLAITDGYHYWGYMDMDRAIRNGTDMALKNYDVATNHVSDTKSATGVLAMRRASKDILYTVVNSREYAPENLDTGMLLWQKVLLAINIVAGVLIVGLAALAVRSYTKKKKAMK